MTLTHACTVAGPADLAAARLLAASVRRHQPELPLTLLALPGVRAGLREREDFDALSVRDLAVPELDAAAISAPHADLAALARPLVVRHLLEHGASGVVLLAPDAELHGPLPELDALLGGHDAVLVPRVTGRLPDDDQRPDGRDLLDAGDIDDEIVAVAGTEPGRRFVDWWVERCGEALREAVIAAEAVDSPPGRARTRSIASPLGAATRVFDGLAVLDDAGYDVSYWNLHERPLARGDGGALTAAGRPLRLLRFAGFRPDRPWWLSEHGTRVLVVGDPVLTELCRARAEAQSAAGWEPPFRGGGERVLSNRLRMDERLRRLHGEALDSGEDFGDLSTPEGADAFLEWLREPAPHGAEAGVNRYSYDAWRSRPDLRDAYRDLDGDDIEGFVGWLWVHGQREMNLDQRLLPPPPDWVDGEVGKAPPVLVTGYLRGNLGLGEAARGYVIALRAAGVLVGTHTVPIDGPLDDRGDAQRRTDERAFDDLTLADGSEPEVVLACVNAPQLPELIAQVGGDALRDRYVIGSWGWEVDVVPEYWQPGFDLVDEVWAYSNYVAENLAAASTKPVVVVPLPVTRPADIAEALPIELPGGFTFLFAFDFLSTLQRKNPIGLIEAFKRAFTPGEGPVLVLKTINAEFRRQERDRLRWAIGDRADIAMVDAALSPGEMAALFERADAYVSLHRSEGFGLTLAESMILGKPVIATRFGGNTDFMTPANSYLVEYEVTEVGPDGEHYPAEGTWAEPSVDHAAEQMRAVWSDRDEAATRGARARADVEATLSPEATGAIAARRLERIALRRRAGDTRETLPRPLTEVEERLRAQPTGPGGLRGLARRGLLRAMRPYTASERRLDEAVARSMRRLYVELEAARSARERDRDRIARLQRQLDELTRGRSS